MPDDFGEPRIRVLCVDDHPLMRKGIASLLANESDMELVAEGADGVEAISLFRRWRPDVTLMDLRMPTLDGIAATRAIRREFPGARIIALTSYDGDQDVCRALQAGVRGYVLKEAVYSDMLHAIRVVQCGKLLVPVEVAGYVKERPIRTLLTSRETEVLELITQGLGNKEIAERLGSAIATIKTHIENILYKLSASDRTQAVTIALQRGVIHLGKMSAGQGPSDV